MPLVSIARDRSSPRARASPRRAHRSPREQKNVHFVFVDTARAAPHARCVAGAICVSHARDVSHGVRFSRVAFRASLFARARSPVVVASRARRAEYSRADARGPRLATVVARASGALDAARRRGHARRASRVRVRRRDAAAPSSRARSIAVFRARSRSRVRARSLSAPSPSRASRSSVRIRGRPFARAARHKSRDARGRRIRVRRSAMTGDVIRPRCRGIADEVRVLVFNSCPCVC